MTLKQTAKPLDRRLIGNAVFNRLQAGKAAHRRDLVQRILHRRARSRVPLLHERDPQHAFPRHRRVRPSARLWIARLDQRHQLSPGLPAALSSPESSPVGSFSSGSGAKGSRRWSASWSSESVWVGNGGAGSGSAIVLLMICADLPEVACGATALSERCTQDGARAGWGNG